MAAYGFGSRFHDGRVINTSSRVISFSSEALRDDPAQNNPTLRVIQGDRATVVIIPKGQNDDGNST